MVKKDQVMLIGEKETFLVRTIMKKITDARLDAVFSTWNITDIHSKWEGTSLVAIYMDDGERPPDDALHFLTDKLSEEEKMVIIICEKNDMQFMLDRIPGEVIYKTFIRPLNNDEFVDAIQDVFLKREAGEFKKTILIVDDDASYLSLVREWLKKDYKVAMANSGLQAIKWLGKNKADLILLDHEMPVTTGPQVLEMLRSEPETRNIPVMFLTGKSDKESVMQVMSLKPQGYFLKSIQKDELLQQLSDFFFKQLG